ncbi:hypothetical protein ASG41_03680 [Modestobacter sp. Leaf380]|nr:hypothetical protein ASG41_03680 [Modestobacter sp. Leaf380]
MYGVDAQDAEADSWIGRNLCFALSPAEARAHMRGAGFHEQRTRATWTPRQAPPEGVPAHLAAEDTR